MERETGDISIATVDYKNGIKSADMPTVEFLELRDEPHYRRYNSFKVTIRMRPKAWQRTDSKGKARYNPTKMRAAQKEIRQHLVEFMAGREPFRKGVICDRIFYFKSPEHKNNPRRRAETAPGMPYITTPDEDNLGKLISDALNGVVWTDDKLIYDGRNRKFYAEEDRIELFVRGEV